MNGIEALQAMKDGKTVMMHRYPGKEDPRDAYYCYRHKYTYNNSEYSKFIWVRFRYEWTWEQSENPAEFWMKTDGFEIVEDVQ